MIAFYIVRGYDVNKLINLSSIEKAFFHYAMEFYYEEKAKEYKQLFGK